MGNTQDTEGSPRDRARSAPRPSGRAGAWCAALLAALLGSATLFAPAASAGGGSQAEVDKATRLAQQGDRLLKKGQYFPASERYSAAVLANPSCGWNKIAFGHSLFGLGRYAYAAFNFRRGVRYMEYPLDLTIPMDATFPSRKALDQALRDLRRYLGYYPGDYHALTVLAHVSFFRHDRKATRDACLQLLQQDPRDPFALYLLRRLQGGKASVAVAKATPAPPARTPSPGAHAGLARPIPDPEGAAGAPALIPGVPRAAIARPDGQ